MDCSDTSTFTGLSSAHSSKIEPELSLQQETGQSSDCRTLFGHNITVGGAVGLLHAASSEDKKWAEEVTEISADTALGSRQAEPVEPEQNLMVRVGNVPVAETGVGDGAASFADWVDRFLSIPLDEYQPVDKKVMKKMHDSYQKKIAKNKDKTTEHFLKFKMLLNKVVYDWQKSNGGEQIKEKVTKKLASLCLYMQSEFIFSSYIKHLVLLKVYRDCLYHKPISDGDRHLILEVLNTDLLDNRRKLTRNWLFVDFYSLQLFYFFGALPNFEDGVNYKKAFDLLSQRSLFSSGLYDLLSPVSFTIFDSARFLFGSMEFIQANEKELNLTDSLASIMRVFIVTFLSGNFESEEERRISWLRSISGFNVDIYSILSSVVAGFALFMLKPDTKAKRLKFLYTIKGLLERAKEKAGREVESKSLGECVGLLTYMQVQTVLNRKGVRVKHGGGVLGGRLYSEIAEQNPNYWSTVYFFYHQAGKWELAASAADHYASYLEDKSRVLSEYWSDISGRERNLLIESSINLDESYDIDAALKLFDTPPAQWEATTQEGKRRRRHQPKGVSVSSGQKAGQSAGQNVASPQSSSEVKGQLLSFAPRGHRQERPVIKSIAQEVNHPGALSGSEMYRIKSAKGSIQPYEKLLSCHWNPKVWAVLTSIRTVRGSQNLDKEREIYQQVMGSPILKACIGIERIWEERAWTELHQFDDFFRVGVLPCAMKEEAEKWIKNARELYILPSLAHCMNLDQINADIDPEAVWTAVMDLLAKPELAPAGINQEIRFRLRCLFSSMGHTYSLSAMVNSRHSSHLRQTANAWYGLKAIDPNYSPQLSGKKKNGAVSMI